jgi:hypothetical protein
LFDDPFSSGDLLLAAVLLVLAAFLLVFSSRRKIARHHSEVTKEWTACRARMACRVPTYSQKAGRFLGCNAS